MLEDILRKLEFDSFYEKNGSKIGKYVLTSLPVSVPTLTYSILYFGEKIYNLLK